MSEIQVRLEVNALTTPPSYRIMYVPKNVVDTKELAVRMAKALPNYSEEEFRTFLAVRNQIIQESLINGEQVTEDDFATYTLSVSGKLLNPEDPLPQMNKYMHVRIYPLKALRTAVCYAAKVTRLPMEKKLPLINTAEDTLLELKDVLNPQGLLHLTGNDLFFDRKKGTGECVIEGTRNGRTVQTRFGKVEPSEVIIMPDIPTQDAPWNNEYTVSISTRYSEHGTLRTGTYSRMLRTPLPWDGMPHEGGSGVLTGNADVPYVTIESGTISANTTLRIEVIFDSREDRLLFTLLDMNEDGKKGTALVVTENGDITLQGFEGSALSSMSLIVHEYAALKEMIRNSYSGRLVDIVQIELA